MQQHEAQKSTTFYRAWERQVRKGNIRQMENIEYVRPQDIEKRSFAIITKELKEKGIVLPKEQELVTKRAIHTSADFDYAKTMTYSEHAVAVAKELIRKRCRHRDRHEYGVGGREQKELAKYGGVAHCFMADEEVARIAPRAWCHKGNREHGKGSRAFKTGYFCHRKCTDSADRTLHDDLERHLPACVHYWRPVGFVNVEASQRTNLKNSIPHIVNRGRKGGSNIAAAICNALLYELRDGI